MITLDDYLMARQPPADLIPNAERTVLKANMLIAHYVVQVPDAVPPRVQSGYRTPEVNLETPGAAPGSLHMSCRAVDLSDATCTIGGKPCVRPFARWCFANLHVLADLDLWMEDPRATAGARPWVHVQTEPPRSGLRVFIPDARWAERLAGEALSQAVIR